MMRLPKLRLNALVWPAVSLSVLLTVGCIYSPSGINASKTLYPTPDEDGIVTITYTPSEANKPSEQVRFQLLPEEENATALEKVDDGTGPDYIATFSTTGLENGLHFVDVFHDDAEELAAKLAFVIPEPEASGEEAASGEESTEEEDASGEE
jgi:hypothetical protein